jgi:glycosyltransferase involved in cell wall biosynthesis
VNAYPLAVVAPQLGARSETFIRRHVLDLLPGRTVAVAGTITGSYVGHWKVDGPVLALDDINYSVPSRVRRAVLSRAGIARTDPLNSRVERFLREHKVEVVLSEYLHFGLRWLGSAQRLGIRFFGHAHGYDVSSLLRDPCLRQEYRRYNDSNGVITMSCVGRKRLIDLGIDESKVHAIPYGVDVPTLFPEGLPRPTVRCLSVGRMVAKKAPILALDAFRRAAEACPNLHLDYVGEGVLLPAARQFVRAFGLGDRVALHQGQPNEVVQRLMGEADIFIQHSITDEDTGDEEGLPVAILEAMAQGLPIVSTDHSGIPEAVVEGHTGYLVAEGDSQAMGDRIVALARDPELRRRLGVAGWQRALKRFTWQRERADLLKVLRLS